VRSDRDAPITLGVTGASGAPYAVRLLRALNDSGTPVRLIVSAYGWRLLQEESGIRGVEALRQATGSWDRVEYFQPADRGGTPASGSAPSRGMVICPCSMGTLASIVAGTSRSLMERAADVALKERRPLILVPRETPLSLIHLENMVRVTRAGATVMPAAPGFYNEPRSIDDLVEFVVARVLDHLDVPHELGSRYRSGGRTLGEATEGKDE
jgi:flavin prenyltransferase